LGYPVSGEAMESRLERLLSRPGQIVLLAERPDGLVVGWLHASEQELLESGTRCEIQGLVVDESYRRRGAGRQLVAAAEAWARERGLEQMAVRSNVARLESHTFYEKLEYRRVKTQHAYRKQLNQTG
jgi:GNAT superfamily N-acetyltransferase